MTDYVVPLPMVVMACVLCFAAGLAICSKAWLNARRDARWWRKQYVRAANDTNRIRRERDRYRYRLHPAGIAPPARKRGPLDRTRQQPALGPAPTPAPDWCFTEPEDTEPLVGGIQVWDQRLRNTSELVLPDFEGAQ